MDVVILGMLKKYIQETLVGMGALKGAPCTVQGVVDNGDGTQTLTLKWEDTEGGTHTSDIVLPSAIFDITSPTNGQTIRYNAVSGKWENSNVSFSANLDDLDDVVITSVQNGQVLTYDAANNRWVNSNGSTVATLSDLTDVTVTTVQNGQLLSYNSTTNKWVNVTLNIDDLGNVSITSAADGQMLTYNGTSGKWENKTLELDAADIDYDNTTSGLSANKVQGAIDELADEKVDKVSGKGLSQNDFTDALKSKLDDIEADADVNVIEEVQVNGTALTPDANKAVNIEEKISKLTDVDLTGLDDNYILIYDEASEKWIVGPNAGATYTAGEGIEIDQNNKISSKFVLYSGTEAGWNALSLADKIKFTHYATNDDQTGQIDPVPTQNSANLMTSGGIYTALQAKANTADLGTAAAKDSTNTVTQSSTDLVESGAVYTALQDKADKVTSATANNFAGLDANGNLIDSGSKASDFASATAVSNIQSVIPSNVSTSNKLLVTTSEANPTFSSLKVSSTTDFPIILNETANENYKGIKVTMADVQRYLMTFKNNHLYLTTYDSDGTTKIVDDVRLDPIASVTNGSTATITSGAVYSALNNVTSGSTNIANINWVKCGRVVILSAHGHNNSSGTSAVQASITGCPTPLTGTYELAVTMNADPTNGIAGYLQVQNTAITVKTYANMIAFGSVVYISAS